MAISKFILKMSIWKFHCEELVCWELYHHVVYGLINPNLETSKNELKTALVSPGTEINAFFVFSIWS